MSFLSPFERDAISSEMAQPLGGDGAAQLEKKSFNSRKPKYDKDTFGELKQIRYNSNTNLRKYLAVWASGVVTLWLAGVLFLLFFNKSVGLSDGVWIALLTTTTINVLGLVVIAMSDLFNGDSED